MSDFSGFVFSKIGGLTSGRVGVYNTVIMREGRENMVAFFGELFSLGGVS